MSNWTFITNHGAVLAFIAERGQITAREIATTLGITERSVHRIISDLEMEGYIVKSRTGRTNSYQVNAERPMRRPEARDVAVSGLLGLLGVQRIEKVAPLTARDGGVG
jgi:predicted ArsR family transcriptional regulator